MRRRELMRTLAGVGSLAVCGSRGRADERVRRVGVLNGVVRHSEGEVLVALFRDTLANLGWSEGANLRIDVHWSGDAESTLRAARKVLDWKPDVVLARNTISVEKLVSLNAELPIVFVSVFDPVASGLIDNVVHRGKNITGFTTHDYGMAVKWVELLKRIAPGINGAALMFNPETAPYAQSFYEKLFASAARQVGLDATAKVARTQSDIEGIFAAAGQTGHGLCVMADPFTSRYITEIVAAASRERVPAVYPWGFFVRSGGLMSYSIVPDEMYRRAAEYVDRILRGQRAGDLPIQAPTRYELLINRSTARALKLPIPDDLLVLADEVIE